MATTSRLPFYAVLHGEQIPGGWRGRLALPKELPHKGRQVEVELSGSDEEWRVTLVGQPATLRATGLLAVRQLGVRRVSFGGSASAPLPPLDPGAATPRRFIEDLVMLVEDIDDELAPVASPESYPGKHSSLCASEGDPWGLTVWLRWSPATGVQVLGRAIAVRGAVAAGRFVLQDGEGRAVSGKLAFQPASPGESAGAFDELLRSSASVWDGVIQESRDPAEAWLVDDDCLHDSISRLRDQRRQDSDRVLAARELAHGMRSPPARDALAATLAEATAPDVLRCACARALGKIGDSEALGSLFRAADDLLVPLEVRRAAQEGINQRLACWVVTGSCATKTLNLASPGWRLDITLGDLGAAETITADGLAASPRAGLVMIPLTTELGAEEVTPPSAALAEGTASHDLGPAACYRARPREDQRMLWEGSESVRLVEFHALR